MEENNQNIEIKKESVEPKKYSAWPIIILSIFTFLALGVSLLYFIESLLFEGFEAIAIIATLPVMIIFNAVALLFAVITLIVAFRRSKGQKIYSLIILIFIVVYSILSIVLIKY